MTLLEAKIFWAREIAWSKKFERLKGAIAERALRRKLRADICAIPDEHPWRRLKVSAETYLLALELGFPKFCGLKLYV